VLLPRFEYRRATSLLQATTLLAENPELAGMAGQIKITGGLYRSALFTLQFAPTGAFTALPVVHTFGRR
jgi:hypothetical protein